MHLPRFGQATRVRIVALGYSGNTVTTEQESQSQQLFGRGKAQNHERSVDRRTSALKTSLPCFRPEQMTRLRCPCVDQFLLGSTARTALTQSGGKTIDRNLELQATRVYAVNYFSATHSRALHPSDSPPQRDGSSCPSRARKCAPKNMPASPASRAPKDDETVFHNMFLQIEIPEQSNPGSFREPINKQNSQDFGYICTSVFHFFF